jgi:hypothetical protein
MMKCLLRPWFQLGKNRRKISLKTERSLTYQYLQAEKETLEELCYSFYRILRIQKSCSQLFLISKHNLGWIWRTQAINNASCLLRASNTVVVSSSTSSLWAQTYTQGERHFTKYHHPCFADRKKRSIKLKTHKARRAQIWCSLCRIKTLKLQTSRQRPSTVHLRYVLKCRFLIS